MSQGLVLAGHVSTSLALPLGRTMVPGWLRVYTLVREGNIPPPAATIELCAGYPRALYTCFQLLRHPELWLCLSGPAIQALKLS